MVMGKIDPIAAEQSASSDDRSIKEAGVVETSASSMITEQQTKDHKAVYRKVDFRILLWYSFVYLIMRIHVSNITNTAIVRTALGVITPDPTQLTCLSMADQRRTRHRHQGAARQPHQLAMGMVFVVILLSVPLLRAALNIDAEALLAISMDVQDHGHLGNHLNVPRRHAQFRWPRGDPLLPWTS